MSIGPNGGVLYNIDMLYSRRHWLDLALGCGCVIASTPVFGAGTTLSPTTRFSGLSNQYVLTIDGCSGALDMALVDYLVNARIQSTWFVTGVFIQRNAQALRELDRTGLCEWQNHGARHHAPVLGHTSIYGVPAVNTVEGLAREVLEGVRQVQTLGAIPTIYRGATAKYSPAALEWLLEHRWAVGGYSVALDEGAGASWGRMGALAKTVRAGDVVLAHGNHAERGNGARVVAALKSVAQRGLHPISWREALTVGTLNTTGLR